MSQDYETWPPPPEVKHEQQPPTFIKYVKPTSGWMWTMIGAIIGVVGGCSIGEYIANQFHPQPNNDMDYGYVIGSALARVVSPVLGAVIGAIAAAIFAWLHNKRIGKEQ